VSDTRVYWFAVANAPEGEQDPEGQTKQILLQRFRGWGEPTEALIEGTTTAIRRKDLYDQDPMDWWGKGRVTLLGDAAHAMTFDLGQGAGQSMEDAVILAQCIKAGGDIPTALRTYEDRRRKRAAHFQRFSRNAGRLGQLDNPVTVRMRELVLKHMFSRSFVLNTYAKDITFSA
jgi:2-polyprenyl-6-methoxyphenol hydroxylase-like FAD-dependent oxidoreductase